MDGNLNEFIAADPDAPAVDLPDLPDLADLTGAGSADLPAVQPPAQPRAETAPPLDAVYEIPVKVQAVLGGARMSVGELVQMRSGTIVELDRRVGEPVDVIVNQRLIARGELVLIDGCLGVTLTEIVRQ